VYNCVAHLKDCIVIYRNVCSTFKVKNYGNMLHVICILRYGHSNGLWRILTFLLLFLHMQDTKIRKHMYSYMYRLNTKDINIQFTIHIYITKGKYELYAHVTYELTKQQKNIHVGNCIYKTTLCKHSTNQWDKLHVLKCIMVKVHQHTRNIITLSK